MWAKVLELPDTSAEFAAKDAPTEVSSQVVSGINYIFYFDDGSTVTVYYQPWTNTLSVTGKTYSALTTVSVSVVFQGDYEQVVGSDKSAFLQQCTVSLSQNGNVECVDVRPGSIIVELQGFVDATNAAVDQVETIGLNLRNFPPLTFVKHTPIHPIYNSKAGAAGGGGTSVGSVLVMVVIILVLLVVAAAAAGVGVYFRRRQHLTPGLKPTIIVPGKRKRSSADEEYGRKELLSTAGYST